MVMGAFSSIVFNLTMSPSLGSMTPWIAILVGGVVGILFSLIHAVATVSLHAEPYHKRYSDQSDGTSFRCFLDQSMVWERSNR